MRLSVVTPNGKHRDTDGQNGHKADDYFKKGLIEVLKHDFGLNLESLQLSVYISNGVLVFGHTGDQERFRIFSLSFANLLFFFVIIGELNH